LNLRRNSDRNNVKSSVGFSLDKEFFLPGMRKKNGLVQT
jgi:hypothetical protein